MPTILDVAQRAEVSKTTVSRVLNNSNLVNNTTRSRVLEAIKELNYAPSIIAQGMRGQKTRTFGVVIPDFKNLYYSEFLEHVEEEAKKYGYIAIVCSSEIDPDREIKNIDQLLRRHIDGLIMCWYKGVIENRHFLERLAKKLPVVIMDQPSCGLPLSAVYTDSYKGIKTLTTYFIEKGHRKIGIIRVHEKYSVGNKRFKGYVDALGEHGIEISESLVERADWTVSGAFEATQRLLKKSRPTSIIAVTDLMAIGILKCLYDNGLSVPNEVALGGFDNISLASMMSPSLTTVAQPIQMLARNATEQLIKRIENRYIRNRDIELENKLIIRGSTE
jgi:LacI family transcriptional regulator